MSLEKKHKVKLEDVEKNYFSGKVCGILLCNTSTTTVAYLVLSSACSSSRKVCVN